MRVRLDGFETLPGRGVDRETGRLIPNEEGRVNFEPLPVEAGDRLIPIRAGLEYQLAAYSRRAEKKYWATYDYQPEANWAEFLPGRSRFEWAGGEYRAAEDGYIRVIARTGQGDNLEELFRLERENGSEKAEPAWIREEAGRVADRVKCAMRPGDGVYFLLTDTHYAVGGNWDDTLRSLACAAEMIRPAGIIHLGDLTDGLLPGDWTRKYTQRVTEGLRSLGVPVYGCLGNHDRNAFRGNRAALTRQECARMCLGRDDPDYFVDQPGLKLRMIFLDSFDPERKERYGFSEETIRKFRKMLKGVPEGYRALVFSHVPPLGQLHFWSDGILGSREVVGLLTEFQARRGTALGWLHGHNHADQVYEGERFPIAAIGCGKLEYFTQYKPRGSVTAPRRPGEPRQELWDALVVHRDCRDLELIRYGAGMDRHLRARG